MYANNNDVLHIVRGNPPPPSRVRRHPPTTQVREREGSHFQYHSLSFFAREEGLGIKSHQVRKREENISPYFSPFPFESVTALVGECFDRGGFGREAVARVIGLGRGCCQRLAV